MAQLSHTGGLNNYLPAWSPDSRHIAFIGGQHGTDESTAEVFVIDVARQQPEATDA